MFLFRISGGNRRWVENLQKRGDKKWNFSNCFGSWDGKLVMQCPQLSMAKYRNSKGTLSVILYGFGGRLLQLYVCPRRNSRESIGLWCVCQIQTSWMWRYLQSLYRSQEVPFLTLWLTMLSPLLSTWWNSFLIDFKSL